MENILIVAIGLCLGICAGLTYQLVLLNKRMDMYWKVLQGLVNCLNQINKKGK